MRRFPAPQPLSEPLVALAPADVKFNTAATAERHELADSRCAIEQLRERSEVVKPSVRRAEGVNQHDRMRGEILLRRDDRRRRSMQQLIPN
jgi:hypothetical protein